MTYNVQPWQAGTLAENIAKAGVSRRDFMKFCSGLAAIYAVGTPALANAAPAQKAAQSIAKALGEVQKPNVVWLQLQECTGCMESVLRSGGTTVEEVVLNLLSVNYNELIMAAAGEAAEKALADTNAQPHILVVNGSVPMKDNGIYCTIGGRSAEDVLRESAENATMILAVGACAVYGSVQAARPNPTGAVGVDEIIKDKPVINVAGCPPIGEVITASLAYILTHGEAPELDSEGRPLFAYGQRIHDSCPRRAHFDAGQYVRTFDDAGARDGWCLYDVGCKGPSTFSPCPILQWNLKSGWPIGAGHPCIGCTEKHFYDRFTPFYDKLPNIPGFGIEVTAEKVGLGLTGLVAAGVAAHAGVTAVKAAADRKATANSPMAAFGDKVETSPATATPAASTGTTSAASTGTPTATTSTTDTTDPKSEA